MAYMQRVFLILIAGVTVISFSGCSQKNNIENNTSDSAFESESGHILEKTEESEAEQSGNQTVSDGTPKHETDSYAGKYADYDTNEPNLEIQKNDNGTYKIQIGIYRLAYFDDGIGEVTDDGLKFSATAPDGNIIDGIITLDKDVATVKFISSEWSEYSSVNEYKYHRTSESSSLYE